MKNILNRENILLIIFFCVNATLKFFFIDSQPIGHDEPFSIFHAQLSLPELTANLVKGNNPPLFEIILHYWISLFGISAFSVRFLPYLFSILALPFVFKIGSRFFNVQTAIIATLLFIFSNINTYFAYDVRVYSLLILLSVISQYLFLEIRNNSKKVLPKIFFILTNILLMYAHYFGIFILFIQGVTLIVDKEFRKNIKQYLLLYAIVILSFLPLLITVFNQLYSSTTAGTWVVSPSGFKSVYFMFIHFCNSPTSTIIILVMLVASAFFIKKNSEKTPNKLIALWFFVPFFGMFIISFFVPMYLPRYVVYGAPAIYILIAHQGLQFFKKRYFINYIIVGAVLLVFIISTKVDPIKNTHEKEATDLVSQKKSEHTAVILAPSYFSLNFTYYFNKEIFMSAGKGDVFEQQITLLKKYNVYTISNKEELDFEEYWKFDTIIFYDAGSSFLFPNNGIYDAINSKYTLFDKHEFEHNFGLYFFLTQNLNDPSKQ